MSLGPLFNMRGPTVGPPILKYAGNKPSSSHPPGPRARPIIDTALDPLYSYIYGVEEPSIFSGGIYAGAYSTVSGGIEDWI